MVTSTARHLAQWTDADDGSPTPHPGPPRGDLRWPDDGGRRHVTDFLLIVHGADPVAIGEQVAAQLPRLRDLG